MVKFLVKRSMPPGKDVGDQVEFCATCRPCCTRPHGPVSLTTAAFATTAFIFTLVTTTGCDMMNGYFTFCTTPVEPFGTCGDCYCIPAEGQSCSVAAPALQDNFTQEIIDRWRTMRHENPMTLDCDPYWNYTCVTEPEQTYVDLGETAVCGIVYNSNKNNFKNDSSSVEQPCPTSYETMTYPNLTALQQAGADLTHYGSCGVCSSMQDLAVYVENPDLTSLGSRCGLMGIINEKEAILCFQRAGYTEPCARMWVYNTYKTTQECFEVCMAFTLSGDDNNGPPPDCQIAPCLQCDEENAGPIFQQYAARTRRRSGLLSRIVRPCEDVLAVHHSDPCPTNSKSAGNTTTITTTTPVQDRMQQQPVCQKVQNNVGPLFYGTTKSNLWFDIPFLVPPSKTLTKSYYASCRRYRLSMAVDGFWMDMSEQMGAAWRSSAISQLIAVILGGICMVLTWSTTCTAYRQNFWVAMYSCFFVVGSFQLLALVFFASDICPDTGCDALRDTVNAVIAGVLWYISAVLAYFSKGPAKPGMAIACCCCPDTSGRNSNNNDNNHNILTDARDSEKKGLLTAAGAACSFAQAAAAAAVDDEPTPGKRNRHAPDTPDSFTTSITITETLQRDGTVLIEKVTIQPDGTKMVEHTTRFITKPAAMTTTTTTMTGTEPLDRDIMSGEYDDFDDNDDDNDDNGPMETVMFSSNSL